MSRLQKHVFIFVCVALSVWSVIAVPQVGNAFWDFCTLGRLPGTAYIVSPEMALRLTLGLFAIMVLAVFRKKFFGAFGRTVSPPTPLAEPATPKPQRFKAVQPQPETPVVVLPLATSARPPRRLVLQGFGVSLAWTLYGVMVLAEVLEVSLRWLGTVGRAGSARAIMLARRAAQDLAHIARQLWRVTEPCLRQFDHWLDVTIHKSKLASDILQVGGECAKRVRDYGRKLSDLLGSRQ